MLVAMENNQTQKFLDPSKYEVTCIFRGLTVYHEKGTNGYYAKICPEVSSFKLITYLLSEGFIDGNNGYKLDRY